jgi:hypothetical protein
MNDTTDNNLDQLTLADLDSLIARAIERRDQLRAQSSERVRAEAEALGLKVVAAKKPGRGRRPKTADPA